MAEPIRTVHKILVYIDGTDASIAAAEYAVVLARIHDAPLHAAYVVDTKVLDAPMTRVTDSVRALINQKADAPEILRAARADGTVTLREAAVRKLAEGVTSYGEVVRVTVDEGRRW